MGKREPARQQVMFYIFFSMVVTLVDLFCETFLINTLKFLPLKLKNKSTTKGAENTSKHITHKKKVFIGYSK